MRTSVETRTMQVASGIISGMDPAFASRTFPVTTQPSPVRMRKVDKELCANRCERFVD